MSPSIGPVELVIISLICLGAWVIPIVTLVLTFLIYNKVNRIEQNIILRSTDSSGPR
jgi:hypothetical protein